MLQTLLFFLVLLDATDPMQVHKSVDGMAYRTLPIPIIQEHTHMHTNLVSGPQLFLFSHLTQVAIRAAPMDAVSSVYTLTGAQFKLISCQWLSYRGENRVGVRTQRQRGGGGWGPGEPLRRWYTLKLIWNPLVVISFTG